MHTGARLCCRMTIDPYLCVFVCLLPLFQNIAVGCMYPTLNLPVWEGDIVYRNDLSVSLHLCGADLCAGADDDGCILGLGLVVPRV